MAEMMAFNRRHAPRSAPGSVDMHHYNAALPSHSSAIGASVSHPRENGAVTMLVAAAPRSNSKKRRALKVSSSSSSSSSLSGGERKMSSAQLRLFFLLCVAVYFTVICFADDIVRFAKWVSDEDPVRAWQQAPPAATPAATLKTPVTSKGPTPKPAEPPKEMNVVEKETEDEKNKKKETKEGKEQKKEGKNLRGEEKTTAPETISPIEKSVAPEPREQHEKATLAPQPSAMLETMKTTTQDAQADEKKKDQRVTSAPTAVNLPVNDTSREKLLPQPTSLVVDAKPTANKREHAPLESVNDGEGDGNAKRQANAAQPEKETVAIPELGLAPTEDAEATVGKVTPTTPR